MSELTAVKSPEPHGGPVVALLLHGYGSSEDDLAGPAPREVPGPPGRPRTSRSHGAGARRPGRHEAQATSPRSARSWTSFGVSRRSADDGEAAGPTDLLADGQGELQEAEGLELVGAT